jgi:hypothetical protein
MKTAKLILVFALMAMSSIIARAQVPSNIFETNFFKTKHTKDKVWDVQRSPAFPVAGQDWTLSGLSNALESNGTTVNWGSGRYVMLVPEVDNTNSANSLLDDVYNIGTKYSLVLKLYEGNGKFVKVVSRWGKILGMGSHGFMYEVEGNFGTFFSVNPVNSSSIINYRPSYSGVTKLSELINDNEKPRPAGVVRGQRTGKEEVKTKEVEGSKKGQVTNDRTGTTETDVRRGKEQPVQVAPVQNQIAVGYYTLTARCSGKVLDVLDASKKDGAKIQQWSLNGNIAQHWKIDPVQGAPGYYTLTARCSGKVLDVLDASTQEGAKVQQWSLNGNIAQHWKIDPVQGAPGYYTLTARCSGKALDVDGASTNDGARIQQYTHNGTTAQQWKLDLVK